MERIISNANSDNKNARDGSSTNSKSKGKQQKKTSSHSTIRYILLQDGEQAIQKVRGSFGTYFLFVFLCFVVIEATSLGANSSSLSDYIFLLPVKFATFNSKVKSSQVRAKQPL
jgi:hypothetical protein